MPPQKCGEKENSGILDHPKPPLSSRRQHRTLVWHLLPSARAVCQSSLCTIQARIFFCLFLRLEHSAGAVNSLNCYCLIQVAIKNKSPRTPTIVRCSNCHSINRIVFITGHFPMSVQWISYPQMVEERVFAEYEKITGEPVTRRKLS